MDLVQEFSRAWISDGKSRLTAATYETWLRRYEAAGNELPPTLSDARDWNNGLDEAGTSAATRLVAVRSIKAFSRWHAEEFDDVDRLAKMKYPKADEPIAGIIADEDDIEKALRYLKGRYTFTPVRDAAIITLLRDSGVRRSELCRIKLDDIDLNTCRIVLPKTKSYKARVIPISDAARRYLVRYLKVRQLHRASHLPQLWLCSTQALPLRPDSVTAMFERLSCDAKLSRPLSAHQFRRRISHVWESAGGSDDTLMTLAGWADPRMPLRYRKASRDKRAFEAFDRIINQRAAS